MLCRLASDEAGRKISVAPKAPLYCTAPSRRTIDHSIGVRTSSRSTSSPRASRAATWSGVTSNGAVPPSGSRTDRGTAIETPAAFPKTRSGMDPDP